MPLPEPVVQQLNKDSSVRAPGWSVGIIAFAFSIFFIAAFLWAGLSYGYKPYLDAQTQKVEDQIEQENQAVSPADQANLIAYYSQISNLKQLLKTHVIPTNVLSWLEVNTEPNVYYSSFSFVSPKQLLLAVNAKTEADANQQIAIFENSPQVKSLTVGNLASSGQGATSYWQFSVSLTLDPAIVASTTLVAKP
ncbi:MAG TPA: hypothetical protein VMT99_01860 [Candidatus Paceibacterota bacterium]|nr:hypothetical protein [Candidatus Paceibacterota bacterium]